MNEASGVPQINPERLPDFAALMAMLEAGAARDPYAVDALGLLFARDFRASGYDQTPRNAAPFAWTGGDGVHFSLLDIGDGITTDSPVVMTVPTHLDAPNLVVGHDLRDFLGLGLPIGFFRLEGLVWGRAQTVALLARGGMGEGLEHGTRLLLRRMARAFALVPWKDPERRLAELDATFAGRLLSGT